MSLNRQQGSSETESLDGFSKTTGRASSASVAIFFKSQPYLRIFQPSAVSTLSRVARRPSERIERNHGASIISISWKSFTESQPHLRAFQPMAGKPFDRVIRRIQRTGRASSASAGTLFWKSQPHLRAFQPMAGKPFDRVIRRIQQNPRGEHHQHQLEIFLESQSQLGVFEPSAG